jgi:hypothetical protein
MPVIPNLEGLLPAPLLPSEELDKECHGDEEKKMVGSRALSICIYSKGFKEDECVDCPRGASRASLNRLTLKMEKRKGAIKMCDLGIRIREDEVRWFPAEVVRQC